MTSPVGRLLQARRAALMKRWTGQPPTALQRASERGWDAAVAYLANLQWEESVKGADRVLPYWTVGEVGKANPWRPKPPEGQASQD